MLLIDEQLRVLYTLNDYEYGFTQGNKELATNTFQYLTKFGLYNSLGLPVHPTLADAL